MTVSLARWTGFLLNQREEIAWFWSEGELPYIDEDQITSPNLMFLLNVLSACNTNVHHKCRDKMPNLCGINQLMFAEAMKSIEVCINDYLIFLCKTLQFLIVIYTTFWRGF